MTKITTRQPPAEAVLYLDAERAEIFRHLTSDKLLARAYQAKTWAPSLCGQVAWFPAKDPSPYRLCPHCRLRLAKVTGVRGA